MRQMEEAAFNLAWANFEKASPSISAIFGLKAKVSIKTIKKILKKIKIKTKQKEFEGVKCADPSPLPWQRKAVDRWTWLEKDRDALLDDGSKQLPFYFTI